jgi:diguanylate cyclase (GGDEF)-like protein
MGNSSALSIAWAVPESSFPLAEAEKKFCSIGVLAQPLAMTEPFATQADMLVLHSMNFSDLDHLRRAHDQLSKPSLIVVNSLAEETHVFTWPKLSLTVDVCRSEALRDQLVNRLIRLKESIRPQGGWLAEINMTQGLQKLLYDREYLNVRLAREFANARKHCRSLTLAWLVLSDEGRLKRAFGESASDQVLKAFASTALANIRVVDWLAYYGQGEFCLVMPDTWLEEGRQVAERIKKDVCSLTVQVDGRHTLTPRLNIGVAEMTDQDESFEDLIQKAAEAALIQQILE